MCALLLWLCFSAGVVVPGGGAARGGGGADRGQAAGTSPAAQFPPAQFHRAQFQAQRFQLEPFQGGRLYLDIVVKEAGRAVWPVLPLLCCVVLVVAGLIVTSGGGRGESVALHAFFRRCQNIFCYTFPCIGGGSVQIFFNLFWYSD